MRRAGWAGAALLAALAVQAAPPARADDLDWLQRDLVSGAHTRVPADELALDPAREASLREAGQPYVELSRSWSVRVEADGTLVERVLHARRFLTADGVRQGGNLRFPVRTQLEEVTLREAWARLPDGAVHDVDPATLQVVANAEPDVFGDERTVVVPFTDLAPGAIAVLVVEERWPPDRLPLPWSRIYVPTLAVPVERFLVAWSWDPAGSEPVWATDDPDLHCLEASGSLVCSRRQIEAVPIDPDVDDWADRLPQLVVTQIADWHEVAARERRVVMERVARDDGVAALAERLLKGARTPRERLARIHRFVADEVRYVAFEHGESAVVPHDASVTLARRYGDCKDKVVLFLALAKRAGLDAYPVLVGSRRYALARLITPSWHYFDHMVACVDGLGHPRTCVDVTSPDLATGGLPASLQGAVALDLRAWPRPPTTLPVAPYAWKIELVSQRELGCDGVERETLERRFDGPAAAELRAGLRALPLRDRQRWLEESWKAVMGDAAQVRLEVEGLDRVDRRLVLRSHTTWPARTPPGPATEMAEGDPWLVEYGSSARTTNRHHSWRFQGLHIRSHIRYRVCPERPVAFTGPALDLRSDWGHLVRTWRGEGPEVELDTELDLPRHTFALEEIPSFQRFLDRALGESRVWLRLAQRSGSSAPSAHWRTRWWATASGGGTTSPAAGSAARARRTAARSNQRASSSSARSTASSSLRASARQPSISDDGKGHG